MIGTINCVYETPCGWCSKWDKKCDRKISDTYVINVPNTTISSRCCDKGIPTNITYTTSPQTIG